MGVRRLAVLASVIAAVVAAALGVAVIPALGAKSYRAERHHSRIVVEPGGSLIVTDTVQFALGQDSFTSLSWELPVRRTDGLTVLDASMDGVPLERGKGPGRFEVKRDDNRRRIVWRFPATSNAAHTFTVTYRAAGAVRQDAASDVLAWTLFPARHEYQVVCASGEVTYPLSASLLGEAVLEPPPSAITHGPQVVRFERCPIEPNTPWTLTMHFAPRSVARVAPVWQQRSIRNQENTPLFAGLGAFILLAGLGGFGLFALNHRHPPVDRAGSLASPPDDLRPALAGALLSAGAAPGWGAVLGGILDLARRGAVSIEHVAASGLFKSHEVRVAQGPAPADAAPHERVLLDLLFRGKHGPKAAVTFTELARTLASPRGWKRVREAVASDLRAARLIDADRERTRRRVTLAGLVVLLSSIAGFIVSVALLDRTGEPVLSLPIALLIVGAAGMIAGASLSPLSEDGFRRAERWRAFKRTLGDVSGESGGSVPRAEQLERWLPYAVAFGTALAWAKKLQKRGVTTGPGWLKAVGRDGGRGPADIGATVAILSAGSSAGAHARGHDGGVSIAAGG